MNAQQDFRSLFFEEFVKRLLIKALPREPKFEKEEGLFGKLDKVSYIPPKLEIEPLQETPPHLKPEFLGKEIEKKSEEPKEVAPIKPRIIMPERIMPYMAPPVQQIISAQPAAPGMSIMARLTPILNDPSVQNVNCPGPNQNLTIMRMGRPQTIQMSFASEEISNFMKDLSEKTKIPLLPGLFKVAFQNLIVTAVISEFVGTKFIIEKRQMQNLPPMPIKVQFK